MHRRIRNIIIELENLKHIWIEDLMYIQEITLLAKTVE